MMLSSDIQTNEVLLGKLLGVHMVISSEKSSEATTEAALRDVLWKLYQEH